MIYLSIPTIYTYHELSDEASHRSLDLKSRDDSVGTPGLKDEKF